MYPCPRQMSAALYNAEIAPTQPATTAITSTLALLPSGHTAAGIVLFHFCPLLSAKDPECFITETPVAKISADAQLHSCCSVAGAGRCEYTESPDL